jgi:hypothetical protein
MQDGEDVVYRFTAWGTFARNGKQLLLRGHERDVPKIGGTACQTILRDNISHNSGVAFVCNNLFLAAVDKG